MPISSPKDNNGVAMLLASSNLDGETVVTVTADPTSHALSVENSSTGSAFSSTNVQRDANRVPALWAVSSSDGVTPIPVYCNSSGALLVDSN